MSTIPEEKKKRGRAAAAAMKMNNVRAMKGEAQDERGCTELATVPRIKVQLTKTQAKCQLL